jgi:plastocyanin
MLPSHRLLLLFLAAAAPVWAAAGGRLTVAVKDSKGAPVADAVVALVPLDVPAPPAPSEPREIVQQQQEFLPYVTVVQTGSQVQFPNRDTVQHHVYSLSKPKKFELPLYNPGQAKSVAFDVSGMVTLGCNIHDWMVAYLYVVPTPYFAQTGAGGDATVTAPAGRYQLELLHPRLGTSVTAEVTVAEGTAVERSFTLTLKPERRIRRAPDTKAGAYR